jgi:hypothetical protein
LDNNRAASIRVFTSGQTEERTYGGFGSGTGGALLQAPAG